ncbi:DUF2275 domain-containing protein [Geobacter sp. AOG1]|uniref:DUF2275 domain-containing protein n=1 Tax=Geobacter sp. AOG1 TaxID=1566346 RepID=UPI001CC82F80|nr:DUF2275 domain-containing protein [Geobacter sp. AOG1]GFE58727.1 hypothetical protein AOG1_26070 [Geobacter sp. AOG1]
MEHTEIRRRLSDYLDNVVSATEKSEIEAHLATCGSCRGALADLQRTIAHMKSLPEVEPPPWLTAKIMARVKDVAEPRPALWKRLFFPLHVKLPLEALALVFLCVTGYYLARTTAPQVPLTDIPTMSREEVMQPSAVPQPKQRPSAPSAASPQPQPATPPVASGAPAGAPPPAADRGGYAPPPPAAAPLATQPPAPAYSPPLVGSGPAAQRSKAVAPRAETMKGGAPSQESETMEVRKGAREELKAFGGVRQQDGASGTRFPAEVMERPPAPAASAKYRPETAGEVRGEPVEIALQVEDSASAAGAVEEAVTRVEGRIVRRAYGEAGHILLAQIDGRKITALVTRLERIGTLRKPPQIAARGGEMVELRIRW